VATIGQQSDSEENNRVNHKHSSRANRPNVPRIERILLKNESINLPSWKQTHIAAHYEKIDRLIELEGNE
jgi:hypothetical protein